MTKVISKKEIFKGKMFTVYEDQLVLSTGSKRTYHSIIRRPAVSVFPLDKEGNIYLIDQYRYLHENRLIEAVAGMIEDGEDIKNTAVRELREELGIKAKKIKYLGKMRSAGSIVSWYQELFLAQDLEFGDMEHEESEDIKPVKMKFSKAVEKVVNWEIDSTPPTMFGILLIDKLISQGKIKI